MVVIPFHGAGFKLVGVILHVFLPFSGGFGVLLCLFSWSIYCFLYLLFVCVCLFSWRSIVCTLVFPSGFACACVITESHEVVDGCRTSACL